MFEKYREETKNRFRELFICK